MSLDTSVHKKSEDSEKKEKKTTIPFRDIKANFKKQLHDKQEAECTIYVPGHPPAGVSLD